jgi:hypothetical protein
MAWNHKSKILAIAVAIQPVAGTFTAPLAADVIAASNVTNQNNDITAEDPTLTGTGWDAEQIIVGEEGQVGFTFALRGPGGAAPPAANAYVPGRCFQNLGWAEVITPTAIAGVTQTGSSADTIILAVAASATDDFYTGMPLQMAGIGAGFKQTSMIVSYAGGSRSAGIGETMGAAPGAGVAYTIPANLLYIEGSNSGSGPLLSVRIWRDKKVYDYKDVRLETFTFDMPVANNNNTTFPSIEFAGKGNVHDVTDGVTPSLGTLLNVGIAGCRNGKFTLDRTMLGHNSLRYGNNLTVAAPSNIHMANGQDAYEVTGGSRSIDIDVNQMDNTTFNARTKRAAGLAGTSMPIMQTWGIAAGNNFGFTIPAARLGQLNPGDSNGFVNLTGNALQSRLDKAAALSIWW